MIRFKVQAGVLTPVDSEDGVENDIGKKIATSLNAVTPGSGNYKTILEGLGNELSKGNYAYQDYVDDQTISEIENFYETASGIKPWDSKQGTSLEGFNPAFYAKQVPGEVKTWENASTAVSFGGKKIANLDITKRYPDLDSFLHADYTFVGAPSGRLGKPKSLETYTETLRPPTDAERQILRETLLGKSTDKPESLAEAATQNYIDKQGEQVFGALSADVLKQTLKEYGKATKQQEMSDILTGFGMPSVTSFKEDIKNSILGDVKSGGFMGFGSDKVSKNISEGLDRVFGGGSSVAYNWQKWFDETLAKRYEDISQVANPEDASKTYDIEKEFANSFIQNYLKPRFDNSKSISEFISYMDVDESDQNVLQTQLASNRLKELANRQAQTFINELGTQATQKEFDPNFYWNPELITGTDNTSKQAIYGEQKQNIQESWDSRNTDQVVKNGKTWSQLAYEYGINLEDKNDFARLHYAVIGKDKNYDPVADTYNRQDLASFIQGPLAEALQNEKNEFSNPVFLSFVTAEQKTQELLDKFGIKDLPEEYKKQLKELGYKSTDPAEELRSTLVGILSTDPAFEMRERIKQLNEQQIKPTQEKLGLGYIQRDSDEQVVAPEGGSKLYEIFKKAGYQGKEKEFYTDFFPDATEEDKNLSASDVGKASTTKGVQDLLGFSMPDFSDPFAAMASLDKMMADDSTKKKETYTPTRSRFFDYFPDEEDEGAPSYFNMGSSGGFGSLFG